MADQSRLNYGMEKLNKALDALEASIDKLGKKQDITKAQVGDVELLKSQNAELSEALATEKAKSQVLEDANNEVNERLGVAVENISNVLRAV